MMPRDEARGIVRLIGGGGHGLVVLEAAKSSGMRVEGFYDDRRTDLERFAPWLGTLEEGAAFAAGGAIIAVGDPALRERLARGLRGACATVIHSGAWISPSADAGDGMFIGAMAVVQGRARLGRHVIVNTGAIVEHDCEVGDNAHIAPGAVLGGGCAVGSRTLIGSRAVVLPGVRIGDACMIGAGAVVRTDVPDGATAVGVPAREIVRESR